MAEIGEHWEHLYETTPSTAVSWYQRSPTISLRLITSIVSARDAALIDLGGGASLLVDHLLAEGFTDLTVLDISEHALDEVQRRLASKAGRVRFVHQNVLTWNPERRYDVWHDRAVFHFLTDPVDRDAYVTTAARAIRDGGIAVLGTFAEDGPTLCSGLAVSRYSPQDLDAVFADSFAPIAHEREEHVTPNGLVQPFTWTVLRRRPMRARSRFRR
jgi:SAM-dependent methyltransferase